MTVRETILYEISNNMKTVFSSKWGSNISHIKIKIQQKKYWLFESYAVLLIFETCDLL